MGNIIKTQKIYLNRSQMLFEKRVNNLLGKACSYNMERFKVLNFPNGFRWRNYLRAMELKWGFK